MALKNRQKAVVETKLWHFWANDVEFTHASKKKMMRNLTSSEEKISFLTWKWSDPIPDMTQEDSRLIKWLSDADLGTI
jgi:hypothetical protein